MTLWWQFAFFYVASFTVVAYIGLGILPLLPNRLASSRLVALPIIGLMGTSLALSFLNAVGVSVQQSLVVLIVLGAAANLYALRTARDWSPLMAEPWPVLWLLSIGLYIFTLSPDLHYGYVAPIGAGWDFEFYWPIAEYLKAHTAGASMNGPPNPLWLPMNSPGVRALGGWGFSFVQALLGIVLGRDSYWTFTPLLSFVYSLMPLSVYVFARTVAGLGRRAALIVAFTAGFHSLLLWTPYFNFAAHTQFLAVGPLALSSVNQALSTRDRKTIAFGAVGFGAMLVAYLPGTITFVPALAALGAVYLLCLRRRIQTIVSGVALLALSSVVGLFGWQHLFQSLTTLYAKSEEKSGGAGISGLLPITDWMGVTPFTRAHVIAAGAEHVVDSTTVPLALVEQAVAAIIIAGGLLGVVAAAKKRNWSLLAVAVPSLVYTLYLRFVLLYPYGDLKAASYTLFVFLCLVALGFSACWSAARASRLHVASLGLRILLAGTGLAVLGLNSYNGYLETSRYYTPQSIYFGPAHGALVQIKHVIPSGSSVYISSQLGVATTTLLSELLLGDDIHGNYRTGYSVLNNLTEGRVYDYAVLDANENPMPLGYGTAHLLWQNDIARVYGQGKAVIHLAVSPDEDTEFNRDHPATVDISATGVRAGDVHTVFPPGSPGLGGGQVVIGLTVPRDQVIQVNDGKHTESFDTLGGVYVYRSHRVSIPTHVTISSDGIDHGHLVWVDVIPGGDTTAGLVRASDLGFVYARSSLQNGVASTLFQYSAGDGEKTYLSFEVWGKDTADGSARHYGYWVIPRQGEDHELLFKLALTEQRAHLTDGVDPMSLAGQRYELHDGKYEAMLWLNDGRQNVGTYPLYDFSIVAGKMEGFTEPGHQLLGVASLSP